MVIFHSYVNVYQRVASGNEKSSGNGGLVCWETHQSKWEKNGKRGMLGHPSIHCWLLWFLVIVQCFIFTFDFFFPMGILGLFCPNFHFIVWFQMRGRFVVAVVFYRKWFVLELSLLNTGFAVFDFLLQMSGGPDSLNLCQDN